MPCNAAIGCFACCQDKAAVLLFNSNQHIHRLVCCD
jgi:hypothetical protein